MNKIIEAINQGTGKVFWWWAYTPQDERENALFLQGFKRAFITMIFSSLVLGTLLTVMESRSTVIASWGILPVHLLDFTVILSIIVGSTAFYKEEVELKGDRSSYWLWLGLGVFIILQGLESTLTALGI